ncbi:MAG: hypothetical protein M1355_01390 [Patescibacteria group bacterium]|nr:hypothetical protein [Patescibacteria group bacterium]
MRSSQFLEKGAGLNSSENDKVWEFLSRNWWWIIILAIIVTMLAGFLGPILGWLLSFFLTYLFWPLLFIGIIIAAYRRIPEAKAVIKIIGKLIVIILLVLTLIYALKNIIALGPVLFYGAIITALVLLFRFLFGKP